MVEIRFDKKFTIIFSKLKDRLLKLKITKQIKKISGNPEIGKPMRNVHKGTRELYIKHLDCHMNILKKKIWFIF